MLMALTLLSLLARVPLGFTVLRSCVPNTNFQVNDKICTCDAQGKWSDINCHPIARRQTCQPGQIIRTNCSQCICQDNGQLLCTKSSCTGDTTDVPVLQKDHFGASGPWCTPFRSYYVNCSLCVCPASGRTVEASCAVDKSCDLKGTSPESSLSSSTICIPSVMYLFPCLHCLCSDNGYFVLSECVETCHKPQQIESKRCIPGTFYRKDCNVCRCPESSMLSDGQCTTSFCDRKTKFKSLRYFKNKISKCTPYKFTQAKCYYCMCSSSGQINKNACLELECLKLADYKYDVERLTCSPGEMVPICMACFCPHNGLTDKQYCTKVCSFQSKLVVLGKILEDGVDDSSLINRAVIKKSSVDVNCEPNSLYIDRGRYCLCTENGNTNFKLCTSFTDGILPPKPIQHIQPHANNALAMDFNISCEPNTFVDFDCNTCYCSKNGKIDSKWCTYDDCHSKQVIQDQHKSYRPVSLTIKSADKCTPGSISKEECNFCICPESGLLKDRACTKNDCSDIHGSNQDQKLICEPLAYYVVDCNICFCPRDGLKNVAKCTKNQCEKNILRSDACIPGNLFSDECNVCVCPPNGDKSDKACTNYSCNEANLSWQRIFKLSQSLLGSRKGDGSKRSIHLCFPGEEFVNGCKACVCSDLGLREYASCTPMFCNEGILGSDMETSSNYSKSLETQSVGVKSRRDGESCMTYNLTDSSERQECTPGSMYIIRCRQCICPYMGNINHFCRPLPKGVYCEQAFPDFNYLPMGRRNHAENTTYSTNDTQVRRQITISHNHTKYVCSKPGKLSDDCHICDCEHGVVIAEHCFKSDASNCTDVAPSFLHEKDRIDE